MLTNHNSLEKISVLRDSNNQKWSLSAGDLV